MNDNLTPKDSQNTSKTEVSDLSSNSRRRLLRIGSRAAPIALTLAARPSFACHCVAPSAWGSVVATAAVNGETGKLANEPRNIQQLSGSIVRHHSVDFSVWQAYDWRNNSAPWDKLALAWGATGTNRINRVKNARVGDVVSKLGLILPASLTASTTTWNAVNSNGAAVAMLVAQFNLKLRPEAFPEQCNRDNLLSDIKRMVQGTYPGGTDNWTPTEVHTYLNSNWIARGF